jgi:plasmid maintenance system antidote protein VapI
MDTHAKSANALAKALRLSPSRIGDIVLERRDVTAERRSAVRLIKVKRSSARPRS